MTKSRQVYCTFCEQTFVSCDVATCSLCGKTGGLTDPMSQEAIAALVAKKHEPAPLSDGLGSAVHVALLGRRMLKLAAGGIFTIALGVLLIALPSMREDPHSLSLRDFLVALGPFIVGLLLLGGAFVTWLELKQDSKSERADDQNQTSGSH